MICVIPISPQFNTAAEPRKIKVLRGRLLRHGIATAISNTKRYAIPGLGGMVAVDTQVMALQITRLLFARLVCAIAQREAQNPRTLCPSVTTD